MLTTQKEHELPNFPFAAGSGVSTWRAVTLHIGVSYVLVNYSIKHGRGWLPQTSVFWRHEDVLAFCRQVGKDKKRKLVDVSMLLPINKGTVQTWRFLQIGEIFVESEEEDGGDFPLYVSVDGEVVGGIGFWEASDMQSSSSYDSLEKVFPT